MTISATLIQYAHDFFSGKGCQDIFFECEPQLCSGNHVQGSEWFGRKYNYIMLILSMIFYHNTLIIQAYHKDLRYPQYVWITHGWYPEQWWDISQEIYGNQTETCSSEEVAEFLNGIIAIQPFPTADDRYVQTKSGMASSYII